MTTDGTGSAGGNRALADLIGRYVEVRTVEGDSTYTDVGRLTAYDHPWLRLEKDNGDILCFAASQIRLVKRL